MHVVGTGEVRVLDVCRRQRPDRAERRERRAIVGLGQDHADPGGSIGVDRDRAGPHPGVGESLELQAAEGVVAHPRDQARVEAEPGEAAAGDRCGAADHQLRARDQPLDLAKLGPDAAPQDEVGVAVAEDDDARGHRRASLNP